MGAGLFPIGQWMAELLADMPHLAQPLSVLAALVVLAAGALQLTAWKARQIACCRHSLDCGCVTPTGNAAWRHGRREALD